jgi:putative SOS response-associated peptidase YedK
MCGRYSLSKSINQIEERFKVDLPMHFKSRYNVAPTQMMPILCNDLPNRIGYSKWGMIPQWAISEASGVNLINIRLDNLLSKTTFKLHLQSQRCLVPADGYFEWKKENKQKVPYRFTLPNDTLFSFAGIWDEWISESGETIRSYGIITKEANEEISIIHDRMPVVLMPNVEKDWIEPKLSENDAKQILKHQTIDHLMYFKCHRNVNSVLHDSPECIMPAPPMYPGDVYSLF